jgi:hypothetical protein
MKLEKMRKNIGVFWQTPSVAYCKGLIDCPKH